MNNNTFPPPLFFQKSTGEVVILQGKGGKFLAGGLKQLYLEKS